MGWTNLICLIWFLECSIKYCIVVKGFVFVVFNSGENFSYCSTKIAKLIPGISPEI